MTIVFGSAACAAAWTSVVTSEAVRLDVGGGVTDVRVPTTPPHPAREASGTNMPAKDAPRESFLRETLLWSGPMKGHNFGITSLRGAQDAQTVCAGNTNRSRKQPG